MRAFNDQISVLNHNLSHIESPFITQMVKSITIKTFKLSPFNRIWQTINDYFIRILWYIGKNRI
ncbi:hypothetical protein THIOM_001454 [Candidatus Thiomargarita nelsonii]|uniref:Uncharacterized protein n=1 Tax=Candidatus Thiomargarita nelsonii TaxID=1003181 RepID=A0A176S409_9GAMM|nr:hypothetical protein THIOM_001454 [Candidatus Thiomargarita nelsonii]